MRAISAGSSVDGWRTERCGARTWPVTWQARRSDTGYGLVREDVARRRLAGRRSGCVRSEGSNCEVSLA